MKTPSWRDRERLSAYLDGQLSPRQRARLEARLEREAALRQALEELRQTRAWLQRLPARRAPRNFVLTPQMAGLRPPLPRLTPVLRWAALTMLLLFFCSLTVPYLMPLVGAPKPSVPALAIAPSAPEMAPAPSPTELADVFTLSVETPEGPPQRTLAPTPSAEAGEEGMLLGAGQPTQEEQPARQRGFASLTPLQVLLLVLAVLFFGVSLFLAWHRQRAFQQAFRHPASRR